MKRARGSPKFFLLLTVLGWLSWSGVPASAQPPELAQVEQLELAGEGLKARELLARLVRSAPSDVELLRAYAEFLERHRDPETLSAYERLYQQLPDPTSRQLVARRLVVLALLEGNREAAERYSQWYRNAGGAQELLPPKATAPATHYGSLEIPGPLESFARMAAISPYLEPEDIVAALARNIVINGYRAVASSEGLQPTEYLKLLRRYLSQARELEQLAGEDHVIEIAACDSVETADLLRVLGYRMRGRCGGELVLETLNATRAFLTIDSGFPLAELEQALRTNRPFRYRYEPTRVPVLYGVEYWLRRKENADPKRAVDAFIDDPSLCRVYLALSKIEPATADVLRQNIPFEKLQAFAHVLDFFGGMFQIRDGKAIVPGGERAAGAWKRLVGEDPANGARFFEQLIAKDDGWLASYFDALMRIRGPVQDYLTEPQRMERFYLAIRGRVTSPGPARPVFRANSEMMLLTTRLWLDPDGRPHVPGSLEIWKAVFAEEKGEVYGKRLRRWAPTWKEPDDVLEALFALCRRAVENQPLKMFMLLSDLDRARPRPLSAETVARLVQDYPSYGPVYSVFGESPHVSEATIVKFLDTAREIDRITDRQLRADVAGCFQGLVGLWQIFVRNSALPAEQADAALAEIVDRFQGVRNELQLFDAAAAALEHLVARTGSRGNLSLHDRILDLLAGVPAEVDAEVHRRLIEQLMELFEAQKLVPADALLAAGRHFEEIARGQAVDTALLERISSRLEEIQPYWESISQVERTGLSYGYWVERHIEFERRLNLVSDVRAASGSQQKLRSLRGKLAPLLRDTLVGYNYLYYAPPGGQVMYTNPLFVRSHDFIGAFGGQGAWAPTEVLASGWPSNAGGRLVGSLASLPYALAQAEQNFLVPEAEQALIWNDLVPQMLLTAKAVRWSRVSPALMHWVALHLQWGRYALGEAALDQERRARVLRLLQEHGLPVQVARVQLYLEQGQPDRALSQVTPADLFAIARGMLPEAGSTSDPLARRIRQLAASDPQQINYEAVSRTFGTPKPVLTASYRPQLLGLRTFPTMMGYSSRVMAESWESNLLYFASLADELYMRPTQLNLAVPEWTQKAIEKIFATHLEDWPALLQSLRRMGEEVRAAWRKELDRRIEASLD